MVRDRPYLDASASDVTCLCRNSPTATRYEAVPRLAPPFWLAAAVSRGDPSGTRTHNPLIKSHSTATSEFRVATPFLLSWCGIILSSHVASCSRKSPPVAPTTHRTTHQRDDRIGVAGPVHISGELVGYSGSRPRRRRAKRRWSTRLLRIPHRAQRLVDSEQCDRSHRW